MPGVLVSRCRETLGPGAGVINSVPTALTAAPGLQHAMPASPQAADSRRAAMETNVSHRARGRLQPAACDRSPMRTGCGHAGGLDGTVDSPRTLHGGSRGRMGPGSGRASANIQNVDFSSSLPTRAPPGGLRRVHDWPCAPSCPWCISPWAGRRSSQARQGRLDGLGQGHGRRLAVLGGQGGQQGGCLGQQGPIRPGHAAADSCPLLLCLFEPTAPGAQRQPARLGWLGGQQPFPGRPRALIWFASRSHGLSCHAAAPSGRDGAVLAPRGCSSLPAGRSATAGALQRARSPRSRRKPPTLGAVCQLDRLAACAGLPQSGRRRAVLARPGRPNLLCSPQPPRLLAGGPMAQLLA